jgi:hypothetical protein
MKNILIIGNGNLFEKFLTECLVERDYKVFHKKNSYELTKFLTLNKIDVVILNFLQQYENHEDLIPDILTSNFKKFILLEDGIDLYTNSLNTLPYSVYKKVVPKNKKCKHIKAIEDLIFQMKQNSIVFRISEIYGPHIHYGIIFDLMHKNSTFVIGGKRDFIYEGDVIHAVEIGIEANANGIFDIANGKSIKIKEELLPKILKCRIHKPQLEMKRKKFFTEFNCENFKFYKWQPLVSIDAGLQIMKKTKIQLEK